MMHMTTSEIVGLTAPVMFLYAYGMISLGRWQSTMFKYHLLNFLGAAAVLISLIDHYNLPVLFLEICWGAISVVGMVKAQRSTR